MEIFMGTAGYSDEDWRGLLYPETGKKSDFLAVYAQHYNTVEINSSFYAIPGIKAFEGMVKKSEGRVQFAVKLHSSMTHKRDATPDLYTRLKESVAPLREAGILGPFLAQFPYSFKRTPPNRRYLLGVIEQLKGEQLAVEFRHDSWDEPRVREGLTSFGVSWVSSDYPPLAGLPQPQLHLTTQVAYVRMHGRNTQTWWEGKSASERHDYLYSADELRPWVLALGAAKDISRVYMVLANTTKGHALKNLTMLQELLKEIRAP